MPTQDDLNVAPDMPLGAWPGSALPAEASLGLPAVQPRAETLAPAPRPIELPLAARRLRLLGVPIVDMQFDDAVAFVSSLLEDEPPTPRTLYFVNAHTLNLAYENAAYRAVLNRADYVLGDGTGVRWAARRQGVRLQDNLNGTDLVPAVLDLNAGRQFRYYMLGTTAEVMERSAQEARRAFPGWELAGYHHGFLNETNEADVIAEINRARPHLLLVAMGNPLHEMWIDRNRQRLRARLCLGVGALADRWAGDLIRAPLWVRRLGCEWVDILRRQPHKWRRYVLGNPKFLYRVWRNREPSQAG
jgi:N-acetylglucosaminyldiphosphoundecaprenol N-acetyl-beta-D-mannosaminyltransferase